MLSMPALRRSRGKSMAARLASRGAERLAAGALNGVAMVLIAGSETVVDGSSIGAAAFTFQFSFLMRIIHQAHKRSDNLALTANGKDSACIRPQGKLY